MDNIAFTLGEFDVTYSQLVTIGAAGLIVLVLLAIAILVSVLRGHSKEAARQAGLEAQNLHTRIGERDTRIIELEAQLDHHRRANTNLQADAAALKAQMAEQQRQAEDALNRFKTMRQQTTDEFKLIANDVLKSHGETFTKQNREQVDVLLKPLKDKIGEFQKEAVEGRTKIAEHLKRLAEDSTDMRSEAQNLTRALKGNSQMQGAWGEMILTSVLERSGLVEGEHYDVQQSYAGENGKVRTDVEILLPDDKGKMVVDSKVSLTAFEAYTNCEDSAEQQLHLRDHVQSLRNHVKNLGTKQYHQHSGSNLDFVIMFVPIEGAFSLALSADAGLIDFAFSQGVSISTPTTLLSALRTISNIWDIDKRNRNAEQIADRAGKLFDKFSGFLGTMDKLGKSIDTAQQSFADAKGQLRDGAGNVVRQVEMLQELGAKSSKVLPAGWEADDEGDAPDIENPRPQIASGDV